MDSNKKIKKVNDSLRILKPNDILSKTSQEYKPTNISIKTRNLDHKKEIELNQDIKKGVKDCTPEDVVIEQAKQGEIGAAYGALIMNDPTQVGAVLLDFAKQKYGLNDYGDQIKGAGLKLLNKQIDWAVTKTFPNKLSVIKILNKINRENSNS